MVDVNGTTTVNGHNTRTTEGPSSHTMSTTTTTILQDGRSTTKTPTTTNSTKPACARTSSIMQSITKHWGSTATTNKAETWKPKAPLQQYEPPAYTPALQPPPYTLALPPQEALDYNTINYNGYQQVYTPGNMQGSHPKQNDYQPYPPLMIQPPNNSYQTPWWNKS